MRYFMHRAASVATGALAILGMTACGATDIASTNDDRVIPSVSISLESAIGAAGDTVSVRTPLRVRIQASDNAALFYAVTRIYADSVLIDVDSVALGGLREVDRVVDISLAGVRSGQQVSVQTTVADGAGNGAVAQAVATAFDPQVPRVVVLSPASTVFAGGTYAFNLSVTDTTGIAKVGFRATGAGLNRSDSTLFAEPLPESRTVNYLIAIAGNATVGATFTITPFAENREGLRASGQVVTVRIIAPGTDQVSPLVFQTVNPRLETPDSIDIFARDTDGFVRVVGFIAKDQAGIIQHRMADTLAVPIQQVSRRIAFNAPTSLRGKTLFITAYAIDAAGRIGYAVPTGASVPVSADSLGKRDPIVYAYGLTFAMPAGSLGADIAVDSVRRTVYVSNINKNQLEAWTYSNTLWPLPSVSVGAMPWGMTIDNSGSLLLVANSGGTNISKVNLLQRREDGRVKTSNEYVFVLTVSVDEQSNEKKYTLAGPIDYSDRPQYIAQSASGALYYSTKPTTTATPGTLRRIDNFLDARTEPRQIWQYASKKLNEIAIFNSDWVYLDKGASGFPDILTICEHTPGNDPSTEVCVSDNERRVVHPQQHHHQRPRRAVGGRWSGAGEVERDDRPSDDEQERGDERAKPHVAPLEPHVGQDLEDRREERGGDEQRHRRVGCGDQQGRHREPVAGKGDRRTDARADDEGREQEKTDDEHEAQRLEARHHEDQQTAPRRLGGHAPELIERRLHLREHRRRSEQQRADTEQGRHQARFGDARLLHGRLDRLGRLRPDPPVDLRRNLAARRFLAEDEADHRDQDDQKRRHREERVEGQGARMLEGSFRGPEADRVPEHCHAALCAHAQSYNGKAATDNPIRAATCAPSSCAPVERRTRRAVPCARRAAPRRSRAAGGAPGKVP
jgi:hypothetical protein